MEEGEKGDWKRRRGEGGEDDGNGEKVEDENEMM